MKSKIDIRLVTLLLITSLMGLCRVFNTGQSEGVSLWNFTPIGAMALFAGAYFINPYKSYLVPLAILFVSDLILMRWAYADHSAGLLYSGWMWTYGGFLAMVWIGRIIGNKGRVTIPVFLLGSFSAAFAHYLITDLGSWLSGGIDLTTGAPYTKDWEGLVRCYVLAIPFFKNLALGNLLFGSVLFGGFEWAKRRFPALRADPAPHRDVY